MHAFGHLVHVGRPWGLGATCISSAALWIQFHLQHVSANQAAPPLSIQHLVSRSVVAVQPRACQPGQAGVLAV